MVLNKKLIIGLILLIILIYFIWPKTEHYNNYEIPNLDANLEKYSYYKIGDDIYWIYEIPNFISPEDCDNLIKEAQSKKFNSSNVYNNGINKFDQDSRKSFTTWLYNDNIQNVNISKAISTLINIPIENMEDMQVVYYPPGGYFRPHYDADISNPKDMIASRIGTVLIYLNDDYEGGGTHFPKLNYTVKPEKGKAVIFWTLDKDNKIIDKALHGGEPVISGTKWICNKWLHFREYKL